MVLLMAAAVWHARGADQLARWEVEAAAQKLVEGREGGSQVRGKGHARCCASATSREDRQTDKGEHAAQWENSYPLQQKHGAHGIGARRH